MSTLLAVVTFAATYAASDAVVNRIVVYWLGLWDPKFLSPAGNVAVADDVRPAIVAFATLSFLIGLGVHRAVVQRVALMVVVVGGCSCGLIAGVLLLVYPAILKLGVHAGIAWAVGMAAFWAGPAATAIICFGIVGRRTPGSVF